MFKIQGLVIGLGLRVQVLILRRQEHHKKRTEISPMVKVAASKLVSRPVGFIDSAIEVVDLEPICSSIAPLPGKLSWINSIGSGMWPFHYSPLIHEK